MADNEIKPRHTSAFHAQAVISFGVSVAAVGIAIAYLPASAWVRAFLALGMLYLVTSSFTLAKCVRDRQEVNSVLGRVDEAKLERFLAQHDPFRTPAV
jgi:hypothetical protein